MFIVGAGGFARELWWLYSEIRQQNPDFPELLGFISPEKSNLTEKYAPILGDDSFAFQHLSRDIPFVIGVGMNRKKIAEQYQAAGFRPISLIHPSVRKSDTVQIGEGSILCAGSTLTTDIVLEKHVLVNLHCTLGHDSRVGAYTNLCPGVHISGAVELGESVFVGTGAVILPQVKIGNNALIGAGAVVTKDLLGDKTYKGNPAR